jgi:pilus assembly protein Flp/PilA
MTKLFRAWLKSEDGATAIEYGLIAGLISIVIVTIITTVGSDLIAVFTEVSSGLQSAVD